MIHEHDLLINTYHIPAPFPCVQYSNQYYYIQESAIRMQVCLVCGERLVVTRVVQCQKLRTDGSLSYARHPIARRVLRLRLEVLYL